MTKLTEAAAEAAIVSAATILCLPTVRSQAAALADAAARDRLTHRGYLAELLSTEVDDRTERRRLRRIKEARFPRLKHLDDFNLTDSPVTAATVAALAAGSFIDSGTPVVLLGDSGTP
jgi:DNA replication protein DnaC